MIGNSQVPTVSILCTTFNQCQYLGKTLEGFIKQVVPFNIEIIVHDDCSTDQTSAVVKKYMEISHYPIKYVKSEQNLYSKNINLPILNALKYCTGEFIAFCEGDDYWIDSEKLACQVEAMRRHECKLSFTSAFLDDGNGPLTETIADFGNVEKMVKPEEIIKGGGRFMPSPSLVFKKSLLDTMPVWFTRAPVGDYFMQIMGGLPDGALFVPTVSCVYRIGAQGSWSLTKKTFSREKLLRDALSYEEVFNSIKKENGKYKDILNYALSREIYYISTSLIRRKSFSDARAMLEKSYAYYPNLNKIQNYLYKFKYCLPIFYCFYLLKDRIRS